MYLSQLDVGSKLAMNPVAQHLLVNLIRCGAAYKLEHAEVTAVIGDEPLGKAVDAIGLEYAKAGDALAAVKDANRKIALVSATPANLKLLAGNPAALEAFWQRGGALVLCGLTPEGLADYNRLVGVNHVIRPFTRERVTFPASRNPLTAGLTTGDIVMLSGKRVFDWTADEYVASDIFGYVVDLDDLAPFAKSDFASYANIVNGFVGSDGWPLIIDFEYPKDGKPYAINIDLPQEETIVEYTHKASVNYNPTPAQWQRADLCRQSAAQGPARHASARGLALGPDQAALARNRQHLAESSSFTGVADHSQADAQHWRDGPIRQRQRQRGAL